MSESRPAAVAGRFYPDDATELAAVVDEFVATASLDSAAGPAPKAIIAPHAGYPYSGPIAGSAYACVQAAAVERVVMFAPAHRWPVPGLALPASTAFETPLGTVPVDTDAAQRASRFDFVATIDAAHVEEHAIEVQLPFLQRRLGHVFRLVPFVVGWATTDQVEAVMEELWGGAETLIVISSDLSHLHDYDTARRLDADTSAAIENLSPQSLQARGACGHVSIQALLSVAARCGLTARTMDLRNSGDTAGERSEVGGYGAYVIG